MRGKLRSCHFFSLFFRITPADAGKTACIVSPPYSTEDHPRGCGENLNLILIETNGAGSPPRMRGKHSSPRKSGALHRITPADAGKTT